MAGLPYLAIALALAMIVERLDRMRHQSYYWIAIIIVRTAATNFADFAAGDMKLPRPWVMTALLILLVAARMAKLEIRLAAPLSQKRQRA